jgi:organic radical activating enzyme
LSNACDNWCPEVYRSLYVDRHNDDQLRISPCCQSATKLVPVKNFSFESDKYLQSIRTQFTNGEKPSACKRCWDDESLGKKSRRLSAIEFFDLPGPSDTVVLESFDHNATWACNLGCIMCGPQSSSTWATELNMSQLELVALGRKFQKQNKLLDYLNLSSIKKIHFNGGEPMLNDEQSKILEQIDLSTAFVSYNTNGTIYPSERIINLWKKTKLVKLFFSVDATASAFEYVRYPGKWDLLVNNIKTMRKELPSNIMFGFNVTVGSYNVLEMPLVYNWFMENLSTNREGDSSDFCWQLAYNYNISDLLPNVKQETISALSTIEQFSGIVHVLKSTMNNHNNNWITRLDQIDQRRNTRWRKSLQIGKYY